MTMCIITVLKEVALYRTMMSEYYRMTNSIRTRVFLKIGRNMRNGVSSDCRTHIREAPRW